LTEAEKIRFFENEVRPVLAAGCFSCHGGGGGAQAKPRLTSRSGSLKGGNSGPAGSLGAPAGSLPPTASNYQGREMPPPAKLPPAQIGVLTRGGEMSLPWTRGKESAAARRGPPPVDAKAKQFWSFRPVRRPAVPAVKNRAWVRNPIDAFVLA